MADGKWVVDKNTVYWTHHHYAGTISPTFTTAYCREKEKYFFQRRGRKDKHNNASPSYSYLFSSIYGCHF